MRYMRLLGAAVVAALALGTMVATTASAEDGFFLKPGTKNKFTISGGTYTLSTLSAFANSTCTGASGSGSVSGNATETFSGTLSITGCGTSLGDSGGTILLKFKGLLCTYTQGGTLKVGFYIENEETVHIEGLLLILLLAKSAQIAEITPTRLAATKFTLAFTFSSNGDQMVSSCSNLGTTLTPSITVVENESSETMAAIRTSMTLTTEESTTIDG